jgi:hypothetical protein
MTAIAPAPEGVAKATIESLYNIILGYKSQRLNLNKYLFIYWAAFWQPLLVKSNFIVWF